MADISIGFAGTEGNLRGSSTAGPDLAEIARVRDALAQGRLPGPPADDRALARMLGASLLAGLLMTGGLAWGLLHLLT
ncbi:hypothetical protein [Rubellimicrobium roseum]|uniref:Uncharacterized protein n=1 Tax=Rubellimicrobium roseum TaxID=687525 RepID=A0A5C4NKU1_9RHOB|nr:hypothetical protein [Rubellimicrobium roseum]TNC74610.1 hypothetical protein FHG71_00265 [Rubellimicrobium roseum]